MNISFQSISGSSIKGSFKKTDTIKTACNFLSSLLKVPSQLIRIRNPKDSVFLSDVSKIGDLIKKKDLPFFIYFILPSAPEILKTNFNNTRLSNGTDTKKENTFSNYDIKIISLPQPIFEVINCVTKEPTLMARRIYKDYSRSFNLPSDFYAKVESLHQMGFEIEESKEALRSSDFNVEAAVNRLINNQNIRRSSDEDMLRNGPANLLDILEFISSIRNDGNPDPDRIGRIIRLIARRNGDDHSDHEEDENHDEENENNHNRFTFRHTILNHEIEYNSEDDNSIDNQDLNNALDELKEKLVGIDLEEDYDDFSALIDETRELLARSKDDEIIEFITFLNSYIDQNDDVPNFFKRKMRQLNQYFKDSDNPDIDYLISMLDKIIGHDYSNEEEEQDNEEDEEEEYPEID